MQWLRCRSGNGMGDCSGLQGIELKTVKLENREGLEKAQQCGIKTIPTIIIYKDEEECERMVGLPKKKDLEESLKLYLA